MAEQRGAAKDEKPRKPKKGMKLHNRLEAEALELISKEPRNLIRVCESSLLM
jgi:hypothetical protein